MLSTENEFLTMISASLRGKEIKQIQRKTPSFYLFLVAYDLGTSVLNGVFASPFAPFHLGVGKTVYCLRTALSVYKNWDIAKKYIVFMPQDFISRFKDAIDNRYRIPLLVWDDAGFWVGRQRWQDKFTRAVREFLNVVRTHLVMLMLSAPHYYELARGIREQLTYVSFIKMHGYTRDIKERRSIAYLYYGRDADAVYRKKAPSPLYVYSFPTYFPFYDDYKEMREKYVEVGNRRAEKTFRKIAEEAEEDMIEEMNEVKKSVDQNVKLDDVVDVEELRKETLDEEEGIEVYEVDEYESEEG